MIEQFLRLFPLFRKQEAALDGMAAALAETTKRLASDEALIESLNRYIETLEGRDGERAGCIADLKAEIRELRGHLSGMLPEQ